MLIRNLKQMLHYWKKGDIDQLHLGLIAQEVEKIVPEIVGQTSDKQAMRSMRYTELIPMLIKATQEQQNLIEQQSQQIEDLKTLLESVIEQQANK